AKAAADARPRRPILLASSGSSLSDLFDDRRVLMAESGGGGGAGAGGGQRLKFPVVRAPSVSPFVDSAGCAVSLVPRLAFRGDVVCVSEATRKQVAEDNAAARSRIDSKNQS